MLTFQVHNYPEWIAGMHQFIGRLKRTIILYHGSYNLQKVLNFNSRLEKSLNLVKVLEEYLISLIGHEKSLKFSNLCAPYRFSDKLNSFAIENWSTGD